MKRNMNLKATAGILLAQATMLGAIAAPTVTALADEGDAKQFTVATVRWTDAWPNDFLKEGVMAEMEEKAGVDLDWQIYYNSDWSEQKSLLLASGELPDAFVGSICLNSSDMAQNKDYFVDLTPYINEETMPNLTKAMEEVRSFALHVQIVTERFIPSLRSFLFVRPYVEMDCTSTRIG